MIFLKENTQNTSNPISKGNITVVNTVIATTTLWG